MAYHGGQGGCRRSREPQSSEKRDDAQTIYRRPKADESVAFANRGQGQTFHSLSAGVEPQVLRSGRAISTRRNKARHPQETPRLELRHRCTPPGLPLHSGSQVSSLHRIEWCDPTAQICLPARWRKSYRLVKMKQGRRGCLINAKLSTPPKNLYKTGALQTFAW